MELINETALARSAAERFRKMYEWRGFPVVKWGDTGKIYQALIDLGDNPTMEQVGSVWPAGLLYSRCDECGQKAPAVVQLGEEPDWESSTAYVCVDCLRNALDLVMRGE